MEGDGDGAAGAAFKMSSIFHLLGKKIGSKAQAQAGRRKQGRAGKKSRCSGGLERLLKNGDGQGDG